MDILYARYEYLKKNSMLPEFLTNQFPFLPNDEKIKCAIAYLVTNEPSINIPDCSKSTEQSTEYVEKANSIYLSSSWQSLVDLYTLGVMYAPPCSVELARAYNNRSAALYMGHLFKDCLLDIQRVINIGYPDGLKSKLYYRRAKCYLVLDKKMSDRARKAMLEARKYAEKIVDVERQIHMKKALNYIRTNNIILKPFDKIDYVQMLPPIPQSNRRIMRASDTIDISYSADFGRHVIATRHIEPGECLLVHKAYASILYPALCHKYCWYCSKRVWSGVPCQRCPCVIYCNEFCRENAWLEHHDIECKVIPAMMIDNKFATSEITVLRLVVKTYKEAGSMEKLKEKLLAIDSIQDPIMKSFTNGVFDETKFASVCTLSKGNICKFDHALRAAIILYFLAVRSNIFGEKIRIITSVLRNKWAPFFGALILRYIQISLVNCFTATINVDNDNRLIRGSSMNPFINLFNHSCNPMVHLLIVGDMCAIISLQCIRRGEQIFINYDAPFWDAPTYVRRENLSPFNFFCNCEACVNNWGPNTIGTLPIQPTKNWPEDLHRDLNYLMQKYQSEDEWLQPDFPEKGLGLSTTIRMMKAYQVESPTLTENILAVKRRLINIYVTRAC